MHFIGPFVFELFAHLRTQCIESSNPSPSFFTRILPIHDDATNRTKSLVGHIKKKQANLSVTFAKLIRYMYIFAWLIERNPYKYYIKRIISSIINLNNRMYLGKFVKLLCFYPYIDFIFRIHRLTEQRCGQVVESFGYNDHNGRLEETRKNCQRRPTKFIYAPNSQRVSEYVM